MPHRVRSAPYKWRRPSMKGSTHRMAKAFLPGSRWPGSPGRGRTLVVCRGEAAADGATTPFAVMQATLSAVYDRPGDHSLTLGKPTWPRRRSSPLVS